MSKKTRRKRRARPRQRRRREQQQSPPAHDWRLPFPPLRPQDRLSATMDYREMIAEYDEFVADMGEQAFEEQMDYFFFFLSNSSRLADEPEFQDVSLGLDPYDFLVEAAADLLLDLVDRGGDLFDPGGGYIAPYEHIVRHALDRCLTPALRSDVKRRAHRAFRRCRTTGIGSMASAVEIALDDEMIPDIVIGLVQKLFSDALVQCVLDQADRYEQDWEERDRRLDPWMERIVAADFDRPAGEAIEKLVAAGRRALPHVAHLFYDMDLGYDDYPVDTALEIAARVPSQLSLRILTQALFDDDDWAAERAAELLSGLPDLVCPYLRYALTVPDGPGWQTALWGYSLLGKARCPGAFDILVDGLSYQGEGPDDAEVGQISAGEALLELGDERAIPILHDYLRNPQANLGARSELLYMLVEHDGGHPWGVQIAAGLTSGTLPSSESSEEGSA